MKICSKCGKESNGKFCAYCGEKIIEKKAEKRKNKKDIFIYLSIIQLIIIIAMIIYIVYNNKTMTKSITYLETQISKLKDEKEELNDEITDYAIDLIKAEGKSYFLDENIVFVLDGYGRYYYTYDQMKEVTKGVDEYSYWAYNKEAAISQGYRAWK